MIMKLQRYDLDVFYEKGTELYIADTLSRAHLNETPRDEEEEYEVLMVTSIAPPKMEQLKRETVADLVLTKLISTIQKG